MENLEIKLVTEYGVDTDNSNGEPCHCCISLSLPEDEDGALVSILRDETTTVFGEVLSSCWGNWDDRTQMITITSTNWDRLSQLVDNRIKETIEILKEVKEKNEHLLDTIPKGKTITIKI